MIFSAIPQGFALFFVHAQAKNAQSGDCAESGRGLLRAQLMQPLSLCKKESNTFIRYDNI